MQDERVQVKLVTREFVCGSPFDQNGLLYHIGTCGGYEAYANPHRTSEVKASMSSISRSSHPELFVEHQTSKENSTKAGSDAYMAVDLGPLRRLNPTSYSLRHGSKHSKPLRNWDFQGSIDGKVWTILSSHKQDESLKKKLGSAAAWSVQSDEVFRRFRVIQREGNNRSQFPCSGIELYGSLSLSLPV